jgi:hypothetical protein
MNSQQRQDDQNAKPGLTRVSGLWKNTDKLGREYLAGTLDDGRRILVFRNEYNEGDSRKPDYNVYLEPAAQKKPQSPPPHGDFGF